MYNNGIVHLIFAISTIYAFEGCNSSTSGNNDGGSDGCCPSGTDGGSDGADGDVDADADGDMDGDSDSDGGANDGGEDAYIDPCQDASPPNCVRYVNFHAHAGGDGLSWENAFSTVQEGIDSAYNEISEDSGINGCEVWVNEGKYHIFVESRNDAVQLRPRVQLYGGFFGNEYLRCERDLRNNETILSGCKQGIDCNRWSGSDGHTSHVVISADDSVIDGFIIEGGVTVNDEIGAGILIESRNAFISNITFRNLAVYAVAVLGGNTGIYSCMFEHNSCGVYISTDEMVSIYNSIFQFNDCDYGGAIYGYGDMTIENSIFVYNSVTENGGVIYWNGTINIYNSVFAGNQVNVDGPVNPERGGGIAGGTGIIYNSIFWNNFPDDIELHYTFYNSLICQGDQISQTKEDFCEDPMFVDDIYETNGYPLPIDSGLPDLHLRGGSPCIDTADDAKAPERDIEGRTRVDISGVGTEGTKADVGTYEYRTQAK